MFILALRLLVLMRLLCAAIIRDLVSLLRCPFFFNPVHVFWWGISFICRLKCLYNCYHPHFCFRVNFVLLILMLSVFFLVTVISVILRFFMKSSSRCIDASTLSWMLVSPLPPFLDIYSLRCLCDVRPNASSRVFLFSCPFVEVFLWSTLRMVPKYFTRGTAQVFFSLIRFQFSSLISSSFFRYSWSIHFFTFYFISTCLMVSASDILMCF